MRSKKEGGRAGGREEEREKGREIESRRETEFVCVAVKEKQRAEESS